MQVPVFLIGGWHDGYVNAMVRMYTHLKGPKKLLIGPWVHTQPHASVPGPRIDWINEASRFFAHWLRNEDTGIMKEPPVSFYMQEPTKPDRRLDIIPGSLAQRRELSPLPQPARLSSIWRKAANSPAHRARNRNKLLTRSNTKVLSD